MSFALKSMSYLAVLGLGMGLGLTWPEPRLREGATPRVDHELSGSASRPSDSQKSHNPAQAPLGQLAEPSPPALESDRRSVPASRPPSPPLDERRLVSQNSELRERFEARAASDRMELFDRIQESLQQSESRTTYLYEAFVDYVVAPHLIGTELVDFVLALEKSVYDSGVLGTAFDPDSPERQVLIDFLGSLKLYRSPSNVGDSRDTMRITLQLPNSLSDVVPYLQYSPIVLYVEHRADGAIQYFTLDAFGTFSSVQLRDGKASGRFNLTKTSERVNIASTYDDLCRITRRLANNAL